MKLLVSVVLSILGFWPFVSAPKPYGPVPSKEQLEWQEMEMAMFCHFGAYSFYEGKQPNKRIEDIFNPTDLDCEQWVRIAKMAGLKGIILTARHHVGLCLWPNPNANHSIASSRWMNGKGDVLRELSRACKRNNIKFGVYLSPWEPGDPRYGTDEYNDLFVSTLRYILTNYGPVYEVWLDGYNGNDPNRVKQDFDWERIKRTIKSIQPRTLIYSDMGPDIRWVGNEVGSAGRTIWSTLHTDGYKYGEGHAPLDTLYRGNIHGQDWVPAEAPVSIRPSWSWKPSEDNKLKSLRQLLNIYYETVGRNCFLLLNVPPDSTGHIPAVDSLRLAEFRGALDQIFTHNLAKGSKVTSRVLAGPRKGENADRGRAFRAKNVIDNNSNNYWATSDDVTSAALEIMFPEETTFNRVLLQENIALGQRIQEIIIDAFIDGKWIGIAGESTVGYKRIVLTPETKAKGIRVRITKSLACPTIKSVGVYYDTILKK